MVDNNSERHTTAQHLNLTISIDTSDLSNPVHSAPYNLRKKVDP